MAQLKDTYPLYLNNKAVQPNTDLEVTARTQAGVIMVPAILAIGVWIALQFMSVAGEYVQARTDAKGGVAYLAHIGGFVAGFILTAFFKSRTRRLP